MYNIVFSKSSHLNQERNMHTWSTTYKTVLNKYVGEFWCDRTTRGFIIMDSYFCIIADLYCGQKWWICYYKHTSFYFTRHKLMYWSDVDYLWIIVMFLISCLDSHSDGTHSLQRIHWKVSDAMLNFLLSVQMVKKTHLYLGWPEGEYILSTFIFGWTIRIVSNSEYILSTVKVCNASQVFETFICRYPLSESIHRRRSIACPLLSHVRSTTPTLLFRSDSTLVSQLCSA